MKMKELIICVLTGFTIVNYSIGQEVKEIDFVITIDQEVLNVAQGLVLKLEKDESPNKISDIYPEYHPGSLLLKKSDYDEIVSNKKSKLRLVFYTPKGEKRKAKSYSYSINFNKEWLKENFIVLDIFSLDSRKKRRLRKPIEDGANYSVSIDLGHYGIIDLNNESNRKIPLHH